MEPDTIAALVTAGLGAYGAWSENRKRKAIEIASEAAMRSMPKEAQSAAWKAAMGALRLAGLSAEKFVAKTKWPAPPKGFESRGRK